MVKMNIFQILLLSSFIFQVFSLETVNYEDKKIEDMKSSIWNSINDGFYHLNQDLIPQNFTVIAFSDLDGDGFTDIITYKLENNIYYFYKHIYNKEEFKFDIEKENGVYKHLFKINDAEIGTIRNLFVGKLYGDQTCYLASFNKKDSESTLIHYIKCGSGSGNPEKMNITSNILILNRNDDNKGQILFNVDSGEKKICELDNSNFKCDNPDGIKGFPKNENNNNKKISLQGGMAYIDVDGNCAPDILLSYDTDDGMRHIEIFLYDRKARNYTFSQELDVGLSKDYGAFTISRISNDEDTEIAPQFDILVPNIKNNRIETFRNIIKTKYKWGDLFCEENDEKPISKMTIFEKFRDYNLSAIYKEETILDDSKVTVIRPGDFLEHAKPGILVKHKIRNGDNSTISLYSKDGDQFEEFVRIDWNKLEAHPKTALFFDINESGSLGLIIQDENNKNHFYFNYRSNTFFIKSKLMNDDNKDLFTDTNLGTYFRYIVTAKSGERHMDISYQLAQTSDGNIPLPYSLIGLGETNNYVENYQIISGNYYADKNLFEDDEYRNFMKYTPIIPNTQMKIFKFKNTGGKYEWHVDLIVQPMDSLIVIVLALIGVMLVILGVIIYLHVREVKEEQKETNKFKSWFA
jgi:hypothetical protein